MDDLDKEGGVDDEKKTGGTSVKEVVSDSNAEFINEVDGSTITFQLLLVLASFHYGMVMTNWGDPVVNNNKSNFFANNGVAFGIKIAMWSISIAVYLFS